MINFLEITNGINYFFNHNSTAPFFVANLALIFGLFIYRLDERSALNRSTFYICLSSALWLYGYSFLISSKSESVALFWAHVLYMGFILLAATVFHMSVVLSHRYDEQKSLMLSVYATGGIFIALTWSRYFVEGVREHAFGYYPVAGILQFVLILFIISCFVFSFFNMAHYHHFMREANERKKVRFFSIAFLGMFLSYSDILVTYDLEAYPASYFVVFGFVVSVTFFIIRYHQWVIDQRANALESIIAEKTGKISNILDELRKTQFKLFETGRLSALASLSAGILHQISQPITAIHGFVRFIKKEMDPGDKFYKPIGLMEEQTVYLKEMLEDLMGLIRHREIVKENIDIHVYLKRALNLLTDEFRIKRVIWETKLADTLPPVYADGIHLQQVFMNVMINAMQAMTAMGPDQKKSLTITTGFDKTANQVYISFQDTGPGLSAEDKRQIFEPFFSTKEKGSGIGLALCKDLVAEHGGKIEVESQPGQGANFIFRFPVSTK